MMDGNLFHNDWESGKKGLINDGKMEDETMVDQHSFMKQKSINNDSSKQMINK